MQVKSGEGSGNHWPYESYQAGYRSAYFLMPWKHETFDKRPETAPPYFKYGAHVVEPWKMAPLHNAQGMPGLDSYPTKAIDYSGALPFHHYGYFSAGYRGSPSGQQTQYDIPQLYDSGVALGGSVLATPVPNTVE